MGLLIQSCQRNGEQKQEFTMGPLTHAGGQGTYYLGYPDDETERAEVLKRKGTLRDKGGAWGGRWVLLWGSGKKGVARSKVGRKGKRQDTHKLSSFFIPVRETEAISGTATSR